MIGHGCCIGYFAYIRRDIRSGRRLAEIRGGVAKMAQFSKLIIDEHYDIIDGDTGHWRTQGIQGANAMAIAWEDGDEAWPAGETEFDGKPVEIAK